MKQTEYSDEGWRYITEGDLLLFVFTQRTFYFTSLFFLVHSGVTLAACRIYSGMKGEPSGEAGHALTKPLAHTTSCSLIPERGKSELLLPVCQLKTPRNRFGFFAVVAQRQEPEVLRCLLSGSTFCSDMCSLIKRWFPPDVSWIIGTRPPPLKSPTELITDYKHRQKSLHYRTTLWGCTWKAQTPNRNVWLSKQNLVQCG